MPRTDHSKAHIQRSRAGAVAILFLCLLVSACSDGPQKSLTIGIVTEVSFHSPAIEGFKSGMADLGYVEGRNVTYLYNGDLGSRPGAIEDEIRKLLARKADILFTTGNLTTLVARQVVTGTLIPVVFGAVADPVGEGLVESIRAPGGNLTGVLVGREIPKALEWLLMIVPDVKKVSVPYNPDDQVSHMILKLLAPVAVQLKIEIIPLSVHSVEEAVAAIGNLPPDVQAIFRIPSPTLDPRNSELSRAAINRGLPMVASHPLDDAVLLTLAARLFETGVSAARLTHQILRGIAPSDLPVETAEFSLTINIRTAQAIGLEIPNEILSQADRVIP